jgi:hypothetical protein
MFDVCTAGDTAHIDTIFKLLPHMVTEELPFFHHQTTDQQRIGYNIPQAVVYSLMLLKMGKIVARNLSS